ncbi:MAG TPA: hypothetical protein VIL81_04130 [Candidatus Limnocylindrales bacterium]|jgi:hypothetical protein
MRRGLAILASALLLVTILPGAVAGARITRYQDHHVGAFCDSPVDGGYVSAHIDASTAFGDSAGADVWLDPAVAFEDPATMTGGTDSAQVSEGLTEVSLSATFDVFDPDGAPLGSALLEATMTRVGDPQPITSTNLGNHRSRTAGTFQNLQGTATLTLPGPRVLTLPTCSGDITDISVFDTNPDSFVFSDKGVVLDCFWETPDAVASFTATQDTFGFFAAAFLSTPDQNLFDTGGATGSVTATSMTASIPMVDEVTGDPYSAAAAATFTATGTPVTSTQLGSTSRRRITEQALVPVGQIVFSAGRSFAIDQEHCRASSFTSKLVGTSPSGPKPGGKVPVNDTPDGALTVSAGTRLSAQTGGASVAAEVQVTTCPEGIADQMGRTLWYKITGTDAPVTIDTAGSNFDTVVGVFERDGADFTEIACDDDVTFQPVGSTFQAALTFGTVAGRTYYVEVGGFQNFFRPDDPEFGLLTLKVN